jgi:hypothetical protein
MWLGETRRFRYDPGWLFEVRLGIASAIGMIGMMIHGMFVTPLSWESIQVFLFMVLVAVGFCWLLVRYHGELSHDVELTSEGLFKVKGDVDIQGLLWGDVRRVQYRRLWSRLEVHGRSGRFIVGDRIENWKGLLEAITQRTGRELETTWW